MIYVDNKYKAEVKCIINMYEHWEGLIIEIKGGFLSKTITIGNIYRPPKTNNDSLNVFIEELSYTVSSLENNNNELILAGDFNINVLKLNDNEIYSNFFDTLVSHINYEIIHDEIARAKNKCKPSKIVKFNKYKPNNLHG